MCNMNIPDVQVNDAGEGRRGDIVDDSDSRPVQKTDTDEALRLRALRH